MALETGAILEGTVVNITNFGAFVEVEGKTGMVHISEVADNYVKDIRDFLKPGDKVKVKVVSIDPNGKMSLSIKQANQKKDKEAEPKKSFRPKEEWNTERKAKPLEKGPQSFEEMMSRFQKDSEERIAEYRRRQEGTNTKKRRN